MSQWMLNRPRGRFRLERYQHLFLSALFIPLQPGQSYNRPNTSVYSIGANWEPLVVGRTSSTGSTSGINPNRMIRGTAWTIRNIIDITRVEHRVIGKSASGDTGSRFYDVSLDEMLGGERQRLG